MNQQSIGSEWQASQDEARRERRDAVFTLAVLVLVFLAGCFIGPVIMSDLSAWCWQ